MSTTARKKAKKTLGKRGRSGKFQGFETKTISTRVPAEFYQQLSEQVDRFAFKQSKKLIALKKKQLKKSKTATDGTN